MRQESLLILIKVGICPYDFSRRNNSHFMDFDKARSIIRSKGIGSIKAWHNYSRTIRERGIPSSPYIIYEDEWKGWGDWLGTEIICSRNEGYMTFEAAVIIVRKLGLKSVKEWLSYCRSGKKLKMIPSNPDRKYKDEWKGWGDWLGTGNVSSINRNYLPFRSSRKIARGLKLKAEKEWRRYSKSGNRPIDIPSNPDKKYDEWISWRDWLGNIK